MTVRPMLAVHVPNKENIRFPKIVQPKFDGIRALVINGRVQARSGKPIRNRHIQHWLGHPMYEGMDGELVIGNYQDTQSVVNSRDKPINGLRYIAFDMWDSGRPFRERRLELESKCQRSEADFCEGSTVHDWETVNQWEKWCVDAGFEGLILREPEAKYKHGRSTPKSQELVKLKRFVDEDLYVIDVFELQHNDNPETQDPLGLTERSSHQQGKSPGNILGGLVVDWHGRPLKVGTGFTLEDRVRLWDHPPIGRLVKIKYMESGMKDLPRHPVFQGFRAEEDTS